MRRIGLYRRVRKEKLMKWKRVRTDLHRRMRKEGDKKIHVSIGETGSKEELEKERQK